MHFTRRLALGIWFAVWIAWATAGCNPSKQPAALPTAGPPDTTLRLMVADDPAMARAIERLKAEWQARGGGPLEIATMSAADLIASESLDADAIIYPAWQMGVLVERDLIVPLPRSVLDSKDLAWSDVFELVQRGEASWGQMQYAIPLGSPALTCFYRVDLFERYHKEPPQTWTDYQKLAEFFNRRENLTDAAPDADAPWSGTIEPLAPGWAGRLLLARAAAYARHRENYSALFNIETMEPLVAGPPFVQALEELVAAAKWGPADAGSFDPAAARREFLRGHSALALSWPSATAAMGDDTETRAATPVNVGFAELPGAETAYHFGHGKWEHRTKEESVHVTLLSASGRLGSAVKASAENDRALELLVWLSTKWSARISGASSETTLFRASQMRSADKWVDSGIRSQAATGYAQTVEQALGRQAWLPALRLPGQEEYLEALDRAVRQAVAKEKSPAEALDEAAAAWRVITEQLGLDKQQRAYRRSLQLETVQSR